MKWTLILTFISLPTICRSSSVCSSPSLVSTATGCLCAGNDLQLLCSVIGGVNTVWTGSAIVDQCSSDNIILRHSGFSGTVKLTCNLEAVIGQSLPSLSNVSARCYTSQLSISITDNLNGTDIRCQIDNNTQPFPEVGQYVISLTSEPYSPPNDIQLISIASEGLTFNWTSVDPTCSGISYRISATGCGNCPSGTNSTTVVCSGIKLSGDTQTCTLSVQSVVCGDIVGNVSDLLNVSLQATNIPRASILPRYLQNTTNLAGFSVEIPIDPRIISGISVTVKSYRVDIINSVTGDVCGPTAVLSMSNDSTTCRSSDECRVEGDLSVPESCGNDDIDVIISATSVLGIGPTQPLRIDGTNHFVNVTFDSVTDSIYCTFLNREDNSTKSCNVSYSPCGDQPIQTAVGFPTTERPNFVEIQLKLTELHTYCYIVDVSNGTFKVQIEGRIMIREGVRSNGGLKSEAIAGIVVALAFLLILCIIVSILGLILSVYFVPKRRKYECTKNLDEQPSVEMTTQMDSDAKEQISEKSALSPTNHTEITSHIERTDEDDCALNHHSENTIMVDQPDSDQGQNLASDSNSIVSEFEVLHNTLGSGKTIKHGELTNDTDPNSAQQPAPTNHTEITSHIERTDEDDCALNHHSEDTTMVDQPDSDQDDSNSIVSEFEVLHNTLGSGKTIKHGELTNDTDPNSAQQPELVISRVDPVSSHIQSNNENHHDADEQVSSNSNISALDVVPLSESDSQWIPDKDVSSCMRDQCKKKFTVISRRHHCRKCGKIFCSTCSSHEFLLPRQSASKPVRVCTDCYHALNKLLATNHGGK